MNRTQLEEELADLSSAEDFLNYFDLPFEPAVVHVNRLHILQRFHDYLAAERDSLPEPTADAREEYKQLLQRAYQDFVDSNALAEKVFKVFHDVQPKLIQIGSS